MHTSCRRLLAITAALGAALTTGVATPASAAPAPVPQGFRATSITWISRLHGWVLGAAPCGAESCTYAITTFDGGRTWRRLGRINARVAQIGDPRRPGVTEIRFATAKVGFAFAPYLFHTTDGGRTWARMTIPGGGKQVFDLAANSTRAFAVVSPCKWASFGPDCAGGLTFWRTNALTGSRWARVAMTLPRSTRADVAAYRNTVYVVDPQEDVTGRRDRLYASTDGGRTFAARTVPCDAQPNTPLVQTVATSATNVALLCVGNPAFSKAQKFVYTSTDAARTYHYAGTMGVWGYQSQLAASASGNLAVASVSDGSFIYVNDTHGGTTWTMVWASSDGGQGWNDIQYLADRVAWTVRGPLSWFDGRGKLYASTDAGRDWYIRPIRSAG